MRPVAATEKTAAPRGARPVFSAKLADGTLVETIFRPTERRMVFCELPCLRLRGDPGSGKTSSPLKNR